jgi:hypothetical protein
MKNEPTDQCANPHCECAAQADTGYCGASCRLAEHHAAHDCLCGHPDCKEDFEAAIDDPLLIAA